MEQLGWIDYLFLYCMVCIWIMLLINIVLTAGGYRYYLKTLQMRVDEPLDDYPTVSVLIPAHNEEKVIGQSVGALMELDYPKDKLEIIVINDNSSDGTGAILAELQRSRPDVNLRILTTGPETGGKGKSGALNNGYAVSTGEVLAVYDADNTPERSALRILIHTLWRNDRLGAVIGKFRTRNGGKNWLTRFINIETLGFQWMVQAGRWELFGLCTIPGTNFVVRRSIIEQMGGWDTKAIAEDTEISFRIYRLGYRIQYMPLSVTWEQEPETVPVWMKQRSRWVKGNIYVLLKNIPLLFSPESKRIRFDLIYFCSVYFLFLSSALLSDAIFVLGILGLIEYNIVGNTLLLWLMAFLVFVLEMALALSMEKGQSRPRNIALVAIMYFTYCQLWLVVALQGVYQFIRDAILRREARWYKTERF
ncbi:glycosyltransferase family 2 protein [Paenibacillus pasadenensis]|uniref:Dolichol-phosphate mannosyltransferase in lipid-linked oligosaccharide synthesis cluster n=1 Tax=Paenibacillus pasadenensis TaxID=217090 RepID=A0A2N5N621_9BACL|nr:Dolichol-phosphate mannosyltransferase in lipid-linked oligosaccharide synthesis cluster [Paenibacillus pasadenensis]